MVKVFMTIAGLVLIAAALTWWTSYNNLISKQENVIAAWAQVESNIQRKYDLLPNLVKTVNASARHEKNVLVEVTGQRAQRVASLRKKINANRIEFKTLHDGSSLPNGNQLKMISQLKQKLDRSVFQLMALAESYPDLKSSENFIQLQSQIEGAENRINITRMQFNYCVSEFNSYMKRIPGKITASLGGFQEKSYFKAGKETVCKLNLEI